MSKNLRNNAQRAKVAEIFMFISLGFYVLSILRLIYKFSMHYTFYQGYHISIDRVELDVKIDLVTIILNVLIIIGTAICFIMWFRRAYYNQEVKFEYMNSSNGWTSAAWFVPILNLYKPFQLMKEIFEEAENYLVKIGFEIKNNSRFKVLAWWWGLWLFVKIVDNVNERLVLISYSSERLMKLTAISMLVDVVYVILALLTIKMIRDYNRMEMIIITNSDNVETKASKNNDLLDAGI